MTQNNLPQPGHIVALIPWKSKNLVVRYPLLTDWQAAWEYVNALSKERTYVLMQGEAISQEQEKNFIQSVIVRMNARIGIQLFIFDGDKVVGSAGVTRYRFAKQHVGTLGISVDQGYRDSGVGTQFMTLLLAEAKLHLPGISLLTLEVFAPNQRAIHMYQKMGFREYGRLPQGLSYRDNLVNEICMYRSI